MNHATTAKPFSTHPSPHDGQHDVVLVSMPWAVVHGPSIQLGLLHACLEQAGISVASASFSLDFLEFMSSHLDLDMAEYELFVNSRWLHGVGEWVFAVPPYADASPDADEAYFAFLAEAGYKQEESSGGQEEVERFVALRRAVPQFARRRLGTRARGVDNNQKSSGSWRCAVLFRSSSSLQPKPGSFAIARGLSAFRRRSARTSRGAVNAWAYRMRKLARSAAVAADAGEAPSAAKSVDPSSSHAALHAACDASISSSHRWTSAKSLDVGSAARQP